MFIILICDCFPFFLCFPCDLFSLLYCLPVLQIFYFVFVSCFYWLSWYFLCFSYKFSYLLLFLFLIKFNTFLSFPVSHVFYLFVFVSCGSICNESIKICTFVQLSFTQSSINYANTACRHTSLSSSLLSSLYNIYNNNNNNEGVRNRYNIASLS